MSLFRKIIPIITMGSLFGCTALPDKVTPVQNFDLNRYLGKWYEVARLDHSFERDLVSVTADYSMRKDGGVKVINRGVDKTTGKTKQAEGKAYFIGASDIGRLKVSFFGPFYGSYNIAKLDSNYQMALIVGPDTSYAWILSRSPHPSKAMCDSYYDKAQDIGIAKKNWIQIINCQ